MVEIPACWLPRPGLRLILLKSFRSMPRCLLVCSIGFRPATWIISIALWYTLSLHELLHFSPAFVSHCTVLPVVWHTHFGTCNMFILLSFEQERRFTQSSDPDNLYDVPESMEVARRPVDSLLHELEEEDEMLNRNTPKFSPRWVYHCLFLFCQNNLEYVQ